MSSGVLWVAYFPSFFGGTFIEGKVAAIITWSEEISLPFRRDFH